MVVSGGFYRSILCFKLGCVWPKKNSQSPIITHDSLEKSKHIFSQSQFPGFITTAV